jgi:hypothetical protein
MPRTPLLSSSVVVLEQFFGFGDSGELKKRHEYPRISSDRTDSTMRYVTKGRRNFLVNLATVIVALAAPDVPIAATIAEAASSCHKAQARCR